MKTSVALLAAALLLLCAVLVPAAPRGPDTSPCCDSHRSQKIPKNLVKDFILTSGRCSLPSVVLLLKKNNRLVCADPQADWVQRLLADLEQK